VPGVDRAQTRGYMRNHWMSSGLGVFRRAEIPAVVAMFLAALCVACQATDPGNAGGRFQQSAAPHEASDADSISIRSSPGERLRTRRRMTVTEVTTDGQKVNASVDEQYVQRVVRADEAGSPLLVTRFYERFETRVERPGAEPVIDTGLLEGSDVEMTQRSDGVTARVLSGKANPASLTGLLITGFDALLLPPRAVKPGETWEVSSDAMKAFSGVVRALGMETEKSALTCRYVGKTGDVAAIGLDWTITGTMKKSALMVFRISGELRVDCRAGYIASLELAGGKTQESGRVQPQVAIKVERTPVDSWYE
jgi:hypothetical protein